jgi:hypothetical protein
VENQADLYLYDEVDPFWDNLSIIHRPKAGSFAIAWVGAAWGSFHVNPTFSKEGNNAVSSVHDTVAASC